MDATVYFGEPAPSNAVLSIDVSNACSLMVNGQKRDGEEVVAEMATRIGMDAGYIQFVWFSNIYTLEKMGALETDNDDNGFIVTVGMPRVPP